MLDCPWHLPQVAATLNLLIGEAAHWREESHASHGNPCRPPRSGNLPPPLCHARSLDTMRKPACLRHSIHDELLPVTLPQVAGILAWLTGNFDRWPEKFHGHLHGNRRRSPPVFRPPFSAGMKTMLIRFRGISMTMHAGDFFWLRRMRRFGHVLMAIHTSEHAPVDRML